MSTTYRPGSVPDLAEDLPAFLRLEFARLYRALNDAQPSMRLQTLHAEPDKAFDGLTVEADGTNWNPGSGAGRYVYRLGAWIFIG